MDALIGWQPVPEKQTPRSQYASPGYTRCTSVLHDSHFGHEHIAEHVYQAHEQALFFDQAQQRQGPVILTVKQEVKTQ